MAKLRPKYGVWGTVGPARGFTWDEVRCTDGSLPTSRLLRRRFVHQARLLNRLRSQAKKQLGARRVSVAVNSWYRSPAYNKKIGGATASQHVFGRATDIVLTVDGKKLHPAMTAKLAERVRGFRNGGIGTYKTFTHVDHRPDGPARWTG